MQRLLFFLGTLFFVACSPGDSPTNSTQQMAKTVSLTNSQFGDYWYQGKAEINTYELQQVRYGEVRKGTANLIFVTEDFSREKQVKLDNPRMAGKDAVPIMKVNRVKKFNTGLYPYSMMSSVFSPVDTKAYPHALKISTSIQEWCGQTYMQVNNRTKKMELRQHSYFESEGDQAEELEKAWLEDELWNLVRLDPKRLPTGNFEMYPSHFYARLKHRPYRPLAAKANLQPSDEKGLSVYELFYPSENRTLKLFFETEFPHRIQAWEESAPAGWSTNSEPLTTSAKRVASKMLAYWNNNSSRDDYLRKELKLE